MTAFHGTILSDTIIGASGNDFIAGHALGGTPSGPNGNDSLAGGAGHDTLIGAAGDDTLQGGAGNDSLDGGAGVDSAIYSGARNDYIIAYDAATDNLTIRDRRAGAPDGTDIIRNVDTLQFADGAQSAQELKSLALGGEFLVNTTTNGNQTTCALTALGDGCFVATWTDESQTGGDTSGHAVRGQIFNSDGSKRGGEFLVNTTTNSHQLYCAVTALGDGRFVAIWSDLSQSSDDSSYDAVRGQIFNADGSKRGGEFLVNTTTDWYQGDPAVTAVGDGRFVVTWMDNSQTGGDPSGFDVKGQLFNADGSRRGGEFLVNTTTSNKQMFSVVKAIGSGRFIVTWGDLSASGGNTSSGAVRGQIFNADGGRAGVEFLINGTTDWYNYNYLYASAVTALADGRFVATWTDNSQIGGDSSGTSVHGQIFNADGSRRGAEFLVNSTTNGFQSDSTMTALGDGGFVVAWSDGSQSGGDTSGSAMRGQIFNADGSKRNGEFLVSNTTEGDQGFSAVTLLGTSAITALGDGRFAVTWTDTSQSGGDSSGSAIRGRIFSLDFPGNDYFSGGVGADSLSGFAGDDTLFGAAGNDSLMGGAGNDSLDGGAGVDSAIYSGARNDYVIAYNAGTDSLTVGDRRVGAPDGTDIIRDVETIRFADGAWSAQALKLLAPGEEFVVNTATYGSQYESDVTKLGDGGFVVTFTDQSQTGDDTWGLAVRAQIFNADGSRRGGEFVVNSTTPWYQHVGAVAALSDGGFVVTFTDFSYSADDPGSSAVRGQVFNADGGKRGGEFLVSTTTASHQLYSLVAALGEGRFVITWDDRSQSGGDNSGTAIRGQIFNADGGKRGGEFVVNSTTSGDQTQSIVTALGADRFVVTWDDFSQTGGDISGSAVRGQIFTIDGGKSGGEFLVNTTTSGGQSDGVVTSLGEGRFVVTWTDESQSGGDNSGTAIRGQVFNADGSRRGGEFLVNSTTFGDQWRSAVTGLGEGRFVVAWEDASQSGGGDNSGTAIRGQVFNADGGKRGGEFLVNSTTDGPQEDSAITSLGGGRFVITWNDYRDFPPPSRSDTSQSGDDTSGSAVRSRIFSLDFPGNDYFSGGAGADSLSGFAGDDTLFGAAGNDSLLGGAGNDSLDGAAGDDRLDGGTGGDRLAGGLGNDSYVVDDAGDVVVEDAGAGIDLVQSSLSHILGANVENLTLLGTAAVNGTGNELNNVIAGNTGANSLSGGDGNDYLLGGAGNDSLDGGAGDDRLDGGTGADRLVGGLGNDSYVVDDAGDLVVEGAGAGIDLVQSSLSYVLGANVENLTLTGSAVVNGTGNGLNNAIAGNAGANSLAGGDGNDNLMGAAGNDSLDGGAGDDRLDGGTGADRLMAAASAMTAMSWTTRAIWLSRARGRASTLSSRRSAMSLARMSRI
jgi:Ca2+-binding RTX toxin-like protein